MEGDAFKGKNSCLLPRRLDARDEDNEDWEKDWNAIERCKENVI